MFFLSSCLDPLNGRPLHQSCIRPPHPTHPQKNQTSSRKSSNSTAWAHAQKRAVIRIDLNKVVVTPLRRDGDAWHRVMRGRSRLGRRMGGNDVRRTRVVSRTVKAEVLRHRVTKANAKCNRHCSLKTTVRCQVLELCWMM